MKKLVLMAVMAAGLLIAIPSAFAQDGTGAQAFKDCPGATASPGDTIVCNFIVANTGDVPATITELTETSPDPGGPTADISCVNGGITYNEGDVLPNGAPCVGTFTQVVPNDPALCGTALRDRVTIELAYLPGPLTAGAFATHTTLIICPADIAVTKSADALSKIGDPINYSITVTNNGDGNVDRVSVIDSLVGDISANFAATLAPGGSSTYQYARTVLAGDPDPLLNTVTAIYSSLAVNDTETASASTNLFQPSVAITKVADVASGLEGSTVNYTITATNTSSADAPNCVGNVVDAQLGINQAVDLASGASVVIGAAHVLAAAPDPFVNTATITCSPAGFPNILTASASATVDVTFPPPPGGEGCTPGYWKQSQHFDSWVGFTQNQTLESVFDVPDSLGLDNTTLLQALGLNGGGVNALLRHAVAALLNSSNSDVDSNFTTAEVIAATNAALASGDYETQKNIFAAANEQGCPIS